MPIQVCGGCGADTNRLTITFDSKGDKHERCPKCGGSDEKVLTPFEHKVWQGHEAYRNEYEEINGHLVLKPEYQKALEEYLTKPEELTGPQKAALERKKSWKRSQPRRQRPSTPAEIETIKRLFAEKQRLEEQERLNAETRLLIT
jgi:hypothetical protein